MFGLLKVRINHGYQAIKDIKKAQINEMHRGFPVINKNSCEKNCTSCIDICPTKAINKNPLSIDMGKCIFCGDCEHECKNKVIKFTNFHKTSATKRKALLINEETNQDFFRLSFGSGWNSE